MNRQTLQAKESAPAKKKSSFSWLRPAAAHPAAEAEYEAPSASSSSFAHDFTKVPVRPMQLPGVPGFSCPFAPQRCPSGGACHACPPKMQAKLKIGQPGDRYEQEADRVAEQVMRMPEPQVQRKGCSAPGCKDEDEDKLVQTKSAGSAGNAQVDHPLIQSVLSSPGQPLDAGTRSFMEPRFGQDFSGVRVHVGGEAAESARAVNARAYTVGRDVVFGEGQYAPGSDEGRRLVAHELVHVGQQGRDRVLGDGIIRRGSSIHISQSNNKLIQREPDSVAVTSSTPPNTTNAALDPGIEDERKEAGSIYNKVVNAWTFLAQQQVLAIDSIYTEAKKPSKPSMSWELLIVCAQAALAGALGGIGGLLAVAIEKKVVEIYVSRAMSQALASNAGRFRDTTGKFITNEAGKKLAEKASKDTAKFVSEFAKDAMKDSVKSLTMQKIRNLLSSGKDAIDAFFEGQKETAVNAGKKGSDAAEDKRGDVLNNDNPVPTATALFEAMNEIYESALMTQKDETLKNWLVYQAQISIGTVNQGMIGVGTTDLSGESWPLFSHKEGTLYVVVNRNLKIRKAILKGSTQHFVALLKDKPIKKMGIPVIVDFDFPGIDDFYINVNEKGFLWLVPSEGGAGNTFLRIEGGATEGIGESYGKVYTSWTGGDPIKGAISLWNGRIGSQKIEGILEPDKK